MKTVRLIAMCDEYDIVPGLVVKGTRPYDGMMAARDGLLIAHDLIEHQNGIKAIGSVWDELEALGGIWQARGQWGDMLQKRASMYSPEQNIASDVTHMFQDFADNPDFGPKGLKAGARAHTHDDAFKAIVEIARHDIPREHCDMGLGDEGEDANGWNAELHELFEQYLTLALHRMRIGFRKAARKYPGRFQSNTLMRNIRDAVDGIIPDFEGQEFILRYSVDGATCEEVYSFD